MIERLDRDMLWSDLLANMWRGIVHYDGKDYKLLQDKQDQSFALAEFGETSYIIVVDNADKNRILDYFEGLSL